VVDLDGGWQTEHLDLEPLTAAHAAELAPVLDDVRLHQFTGGTPLTADALTARYERLATRRSPDGRHQWGNWVLRSRETGTAVGTVQATLPARGHHAGPAEIAWVVATAAQGRGYAKEAARSLADRLSESGWPVAAYIHPRHLASQHVARAAGMAPTDSTRDGEQRWTRPPVASAP
jgi:RimJ/RimL family protein N-acetyltransferase